LARVQRLRVGERRAETDDARQIVLDGRLVEGLGAELAAEARDEPRRNLLTHGQLRAEIAREITASQNQEKDDEAAERAGRRADDPTDHCLKILSTVDVTRWL
jgi:hypothetical protein